MRLLSRRSAALSVICGSALGSAPAGAAVEASEQARIEAEAVKAYVAKSEAEKLAANVTAPRLLMVENAVRSGKNQETELTRRQKIVHPFLHLQRKKH